MAAWILEDEARLCVPTQAFVTVPPAGQCPICLDYPLQPQGLTCQHLFCKGCLEEHRNTPRGNACPTCRRDTVDSMRPNPSMHYVITGSTFCCIHDGCFWTGQGYAAAKKHWQQECAVMLAETRARAAEDSLKIVISKLIDKENEVRALRCERLLQPPPTKRSRPSPAPGASASSTATSRNGDGVQVLSEDEECSPSYSPVSDFER